MWSEAQTSRKERCAVALWSWAIELQFQLYLAPLGGSCIPNQKLTCFMFYLKIINTFSKK